ncbi:MAG: DUF427 domain-containing protein [Myxococcales bacterium]|nr:DUF427 domain-containing protein [Myxococcales bacterium]
MTDHVTLEPAPRIQIRAGGQLITDTTAGYVVHERGLPDRYYVPRADVRGELVDGAGDGRCPWKGQWRHLDLTVAGTRIPAAAWTYGETTPVCAPIRDFIAFYPGKVDAIDVG